LSSRHRTHDPHPVVRGSASAVVAAAYNQSGAYIAYARQCRAFGLTLPSLRDKDKMWRETLLGAIGLIEWHASEIRDVGALLETPKVHQLLASAGTQNPPAGGTRPQSTRQCRGAARSSFAGSRTHSANSPQVKRASTWMCSIAWSVRMRQASPPLAPSAEVRRDATNCARLGADLRTLRARGSFIDRRQRQQPARLRHHPWNVWPRIEPEQRQNQTEALSAWRTSIVRHLESAQCRFGNPLKSQPLRDRV
jgi:hypothetical protein